MRNNVSPALKVAFLYMFMSFLWIFLSDTILNDMVDDDELLSNIQTIKGTFFVFLTSMVIYVLVNEYFKEEKNLRERFENIFDNSGVPMVLFNEDGIPLKINKEWFDLTGYTYEEVNTFEKWSKRAFGDKANETMKKFQAYYNIDKKVGVGEFRINTKDGKVLVLYMYLIPYGMIDGKKAFIFTAVDLTEIKTQETLLVQQSKMATMGEMIANITHQWKQPLSTIRASNSILKLSREFDEFDEKVDESIEIIDHSVESLAQTIDDFRNFFKPNKNVKYFKIKNSFEKVSKLISSQFKNKDINVIEDIKDCELYGFENELLQVIINIIKNAVDELDKKDNGYTKLLFVNSFEKNGNLYIEIKDNAGGIPDNIINRIFDSYFTTKNESEGTGIGLYMSKRIIEESMGGTLTAYNETFVYKNQQYQGAVFKITIPFDPISSIL